MNILPRRRSWRFTATTTAAVVLVVLLAGGAEGARRYDQSKADILLPGVVVGGVPVGGMSVTEAAAALQRSWEEPLDAPLTVRIGDTSAVVTPRELGVSTDALARLEEASVLQRKLSLRARVWHRLTGRGVDGSHEVIQAIDSRKIESFVTALAERVYRAPVDSKIDVSSGVVRLTSDVDGFRLRVEEAVGALQAAATGGVRSVQLPGEPVPAAVRRGDHGAILLVRVGENKLHHYMGEQLVKTYDIATGKDSNPTPKGHFQVVNKRRNPTWVNPAPSGWGKSLPARIGPGPRNPLGTRALDINSPGIRIHGTSDVASIGYNASHGCIRMRMAEVEELFELIGVGTPVVIVQAGPNKAPRAPVRSEVPPAEADATPISGVGEVTPPDDPAA